MSGHTGPENDDDGGRGGQWVRAAAELALLSLLEERPHYGLEMVERLRAEAGLPIAEGTIYPLLHRLERAGVVRSEWRVAGSDRPRKYYGLTPAGGAESQAQAAAWRRRQLRLDAFLTRTRA